MRFNITMVFMGTNAEIEKLSDDMHLVDEHSVIEEIHICNLRWVDNLRWVNICM